MPVCQPQLRTCLQSASVLHGPLSDLLQKVSRELRRVSGAMSRTIEAAQEGLREALAAADRQRQEAMALRERVAFLEVTEL